jgi:hypothetical protein
LEAAAALGKTLESLPSPRRACDKGQAVTA